MRTLALFLIGVTFGATGGFVFAAANGITPGGHDHADPAHHGAATGDHAVAHDQAVQLDPATAPTLALEVLVDPVAGHNLHVTTNGFTFAPHAAGHAHQAGQGHAHVYVNGVKLARLYGPWLHLDHLPSGEVEVTVSLTTNDHRPLAVNGAAISATKTLKVE